MLLKVLHKPRKEFIPRDCLGITNQRTMPPRSGHSHIHAPPIRQEAHLLGIIGPYLHHIIAGSVDNSLTAVSQ